MSRVELRILNKPQLPVANNRFGNYTSGWIAALTATTSAPDLAVYTGTTNYTTLDGWSHGGTNLYSAYLRSNLGSTKTTWQDLTGEVLTDCFYKIEFDVLGASGGTITPILFGVTGTTIPVGPASITTIEPTFLAGVTGCTTIYTGGIIDDDGGATVTQRGIVWGYTDPINTLVNATYSGTGIGTFNIDISGVNLWTYRTYYIRAFATNSVKTQYGNLVTITMLRPNGGGPCDTVEYTIEGGEPCTVFIGCGIDGGKVIYGEGGSACDPGCGVFDGGESCLQDTGTTLSGGTACTGGTTPSVETVTITGITFMKYNFSGLTYRNGDPIPVSYSATGTTDAVFYTNEFPSGETYIYGRLYNWYAVTDPRNLAPVGWHIATEAEWDKVISYIGGISVGGKLKASGTTYWNSPNLGTTDEYGMSLVAPGVVWTSLGGWKTFGNYYSADNVKSYLWISDWVNMYKSTISEAGKKDFRSIRLVKD